MKIIEKGLHFFLVVVSGDMNAVSPDLSSYIYEIRPSADLENRMENKIHPIIYDTFWAE